ADLAKVNLFQRLPKRQLPELHLDLDLPGADDAEENVVTGIQEGLSHSPRQPGRLTIPPQKGVRVEQEPHASPSQKASGSGSSKSSRMTDDPGWRSGTRRALSRRLAVTVTE